MAKKGRTQTATKNNNGVITELPQSEIQPAVQVVVESSLQSDYTQADRMETYRQLCDQIHSGQQSSHEQFDKAVLTLSEVGAN